ncbi:MAG: hypothetical protein RSG52_00650 [Terrisporobacter sp.]|uniref:hypothetical protein n=1 Tax=Terrisporobacter sp. TaxID=1965305 RepID=UPI002FC82850
MDIKIHEIKKIIASPIIIGLTVVFILFNIFSMSTSSYLKDDLKIINNIISEFGYEIDDEMISDMNNKYKNSLKELNKITKEKLNKTYKSIEEFLESNEYQSNNYEGGIFNEEELKFFNEVNLLYVYSNMSMDQIKSYEDINIKEVGKQSIEMYGLSGQAAKMSNENYKELDKRFEEIKENEEHKNLFFLGSTYRMHSLLFRETLMKCIYEIIILVVLMTAYLINFEFDNKTNLLVYSTKRGRKNIKDKFTVCVLSSIAISVIILGITLIAYFINFDYSEVWNIPITTAFNWEYKLPYISLFNHTILERLILSILIIIICAVIFSAISFIICTLIKNSYLVIFIFFIVFGISLLIPQVISNSSPFIIYSRYHVFKLILNPHMWFMDMGPFMFKNYEVITLGTNGLVVSLFTFLTMKKFKREDLN